MGSSQVSQVKDDAIGLYMEVAKPIYLAGELVEGCIYLNAKQNRPYQNLVVRLSGEEYVYWGEGDGKNRTIYSNRYQNYDSHFAITDFNG